MASDIHAAAERLRRIYADESYRDVYGIEPTGGGLQNRDEADVIDEYLRLTDPTPLTRELFERLGWKIQTWRTGRWEAVNVGGCYLCVSQDGLAWTAGGHEIHRPIRTLGELRMACIVLGIELKEDGK